jgi:hypothetical protein
MLLTRGTEEEISAPTRDFTESEAWRVLDSHLLRGEGAATPGARTDLEELLHPRQDLGGTTGHSHASRRTRKDDYRRA